MGKDTRYFQWLVGEKQGEIQIFDKIEAEDNEIYIRFKDQSRINEKLVGALNEKEVRGKLMSEIDHPNNCWQFKKEWVGRQEEKWEINADGERVCVDPFIPGKQVMKLIPPRVSNRTSNFGVISNFEEMMQQTLQPQSKIDKNDPVYILMSKAKKNDSEICMGMIVTLPPKNLYDIAKQSFDDGDKKFIDYIVDEIPVEEIKNALKVAIKEFYEESQNQSLIP